MPKKNSRKSGKNRKSGEIIFAKVALDQKSQFIFDIFAQNDL